MGNESVNNEQINYFNILLGIIIILLCFSFWGGYFFQRKNAFEIKKLKKEIIILNQQIYSLEDQEKSRRTSFKFLQLPQIYEIIAESANNNRITIKNFDSDQDSNVKDKSSNNKVKNPNNQVKKSNDCEITIVGDYPDLINFFSNLWENHFYLFKKIEIKNNSQDPKSSIEVHLKLMIPAVKGAK